MSEDRLQKNAARATVKQLRSLVPALREAEQKLPFGALSNNAVARWVATRTPLAARAFNNVLGTLGQSDAKRYAGLKNRVKMLTDAENYTRMNQSPGVLVTKRDPVTHLPTEYKTYGDEIGVTQVLNPRTGEVQHLRTGTGELLPSDMATRRASLAGGRATLDRDTLGLSRKVNRKPMTAERLVSRGPHNIFRQPKTRYEAIGAKADAWLRNVLEGNKPMPARSSKWDANNVPVQTPPTGYKLDEVIDYGGALIPIFQRTGKAGLFTHDDSHFRSMPMLGDYDMGVRLGYRGSFDKMLFSGEKGNPTKPHEVGHAMMYVADQADRNLMARRLMLDMNPAIRKGFSVKNDYTPEASIPESLSGNQRKSALSLNRFANNLQAMREAGATNAGLRWFQKNRGLDVQPNNRGIISMLNSYRNATPVGKATQEQLFYNYRHAPLYAPTALNMFNAARKYAKPAAGVGIGAAGILTDRVLQNWEPYNRYINWLTGQQDEQPLK